MIAALLAVYFYPGQSGTLYEASRLLHGEADASFGSHRVEIWREVCALIAQRPVFGGGPGTAAGRARRRRGCISSSRASCRRRDGRSERMLRTRTTSISAMR